MNKSKRKYDAKRALIISTLADRHEVTEDFVRKAINNDRHSATAEDIRKDYIEMMQAVKNVLGK
jgi:hypothetical protein